MKHKPNEFLRISKRKLTEYSRTLSDRDKNILRSMQKCKFLKTDQMKRLHFGTAITDSADLRATTRNLTKLHKLGLIQPLSRRIGGTRAGSTSYVWTLKAAGVELLKIIDKQSDIKPSRKRIFEPTFIFLKHSLAVSELYVRLIELCKNTLKCADFEPNCWRTYINANGGSNCLRPDLYAIVTSGGYENHYFFEVDLATEAPCRIVRKCEYYINYFLSGEEQKKNQVFPYVIWIVPDEKRRETLRRYINKWWKEYKAIFIVITMSELKSLISCGE